MKRLPACLLSGLVLMTALSCSRGAPPAAGSAAGGGPAPADGTERPARVSTPVWVHANVSYATRNPLGPMQSASSFSVEFYQHMSVMHDEKGFSYAPPPDNDSSPFGMRGLVTATGTVDRRSADGSWSKGSFDKRVTLTPESYPARASCDVGLPVDPSAAGPLVAGVQLQVSVDCSAVVTGTQEMHGGRADGPDRSRAPVAPVRFPPIFLGCDDRKGPYPSAPDLASVCRFDVTLQPASAPRPAASVPPAPAAMAAPAAATYSGAVTDWLPNGHFVVHLRGETRLPAAGPGPALITVDATVWSTAPGDGWRPKGLAR